MSEDRKVCVEAQLMVPSCLGRCGFFSSHDFPPGLPASVAPPARLPNLPVQLPCWSIHLSLSVSSSNLQACIKTTWLQQFTIRSASLWRQAAESPEILSMNSRHLPHSYCAPGCALGTNRVCASYMYLSKIIKIISEYLGEFVQQLHLPICIATREAIESAMLKASRQDVSELPTFLRERVFWVLTCSPADFCFALC